MFLCCSRLIRRMSKSFENGAQAADTISAPEAPVAMTAALGVEPHTMASGARLSARAYPDYHGEASESDGDDFEGSHSVG